MAQLKQYKKRNTYYGYDPMSGQGVAFADENQFKQHFGSFDPNAPELSIDSGIFDKTPGQIVKGDRDYVGIAEQAGTAGMPLADLQAILGQQVAGEYGDIRKNLGIDDLEGRAFAPPPSTQKLFTDAYAAAGLGDLKKQIEALMKEQGTVKGQLNERLSKVNENPWLSEGSRLASVGNTKDFFDGTISNLTEQQRAVAELFNQGLGQVNDLVSRTSTDYANQQAIDTAQLNYLIQKADQELATRQTLEGSKVARYLPEYLQASIRSEKPDTLEAGDGSIYQWDRNLGEFVQISGPTEDEDSWLKEPLSAAELKDFGMPAGSTWADVQGMTPQAAVSQGQWNAAAFGKRVEDAINNTFKDTFALFAPGGVYSGKTGAINFGIDSKAPNSLKPDYLKRHDQAARNFINAVLRRESGAAIADSEFENAYSQYLPRPGDDEGTIRQKMINMNTVLNSLKSEAGSAWDVNSMNETFQEFEQSGGANKTSLKGQPSGKTPYLNTLGNITAYGSPVWKPGLDVDLKKGDPVRSPVTGTVVAASKNGGFGLQVKIRSSDGREIWLSHLDGYGVKPGQTIKAGQVVGIGGNTGKVIAARGGDGSHLDITMPKPGGGYYTAQEVKRYLDNKLV